MRNKLFILFKESRTNNRLGSFDLWKEERGRIVSAQSSSNVVSETLCVDRNPSDTPADETAVTEAEAKTLFFVFLWECVSLFQLRVLTGF